MTCGSCGHDKNYNAVWTATGGATYSFTNKGKTVPLEANRLASGTSITGAISYSAKCDCKCHKNIVSLT